MPGVFAATSFDPVSSDVGETWIKIEWNPNVVTNIYVDGQLVTDNIGGVTKATNNTIGYFYLSSLKSNSQHAIQLVNASNHVEKKTITIKTLAPSAIVQILLIIGLLLCVLLLFTTDIVKILLIGVLTIILSLFATSTAYNFYGLGMLFWGFIIWASVMIGIGLYNTYKEDISWW
jgi:hypothetical protein